MSFAKRPELVVMLAAGEMIELESRNVIAAADDADFRFDAQRLELFAPHSGTLLLSVGIGGNACVLTGAQLSFLRLTAPPQPDP
jgi:hypothetical protein